MLAVLYLCGLSSAQAIVRVLNTMMNFVCVRNGVASTLVVISTTGSNANSTRMYPDTALQSRVPFVPSL